MAVGGSWHALLLSALVSVGCQSAETPKRTQAAGQAAADTALYTTDTTTLEEEAAWHRQRIAQEAAEGADTVGTFRFRDLTLTVWPFQVEDEDTLSLTTVHKDRLTLNRNGDEVPLHLRITSDQLTERHVDERIAFALFVSSEETLNFITPNTYTRWQPVRQISANTFVSSRYAEDSLLR